MLNGEELIRLVDTIHRDKDIGKEELFEAIEMALLTAVRKRYGERMELAVEIVRDSGEVIVWDGEEEADDVDISELGRIAAQTAKQVIIQKIRDAERDVIYGDYEHRVNEILTGTVQRIEGGNIIVNLGKAEGIIPRHEKVRTENYNPGDRIKAIVYDVKKIGPKVKIMLSRADPSIVKKLFEIEVPEIAEHVIEIRSIAREPGFRTKIAVSSIDNRVDCIGACVGIRGTRIKAITDELNGEKIDIIRWSDNLEELVINALKPAQISTIDFDEARHEARVMVPEDQLSLAIGRKGQNVRLASRLSGYEIQIMSPAQAADREVDGDSDEAVDQAHAALLGGDGPAKAGATASPDSAVADPSPAAVGEEATAGAVAGEAVADADETGAEATGDGATADVASDEASAEASSAATKAMDEAAPAAEHDSPPAPATEPAPTSGAASSATPDIEEGEKA